MRQKIIFTLIFLILLNTVNALDICTENIEIEKDCKMLTPSLNCDYYNYSIIQINGTINRVGNLTNLVEDIYYFNFTENKGDYIITLCDGSTREVRVLRDDKKMTPIILALLGAIVFFAFFGYFEKNYLIKFCSNFFAFLEFIYMLGLLYVNETSGPLVDLLRLNFYIVGTVGIGLFLLHLASIYLNTASMDDKLQPMESDLLKWGDSGNKKWK